jgi:hypothetical protein
VYRPEAAYDIKEVASNCANYYSEYPQGMRLLDYDTLIENPTACEPTAPEGPLVGEVETSPNNI